MYPLRKRLGGKKSQIGDLLDYLKISRLQTEIEGFLKQ